MAETVKKLKNQPIGPVMPNHIDKSASHDGLASPRPQSRKARAEISIRITP